MSIIGGQIKHLSAYPPGETHQVNASMSHVLVAWKPKCLGLNGI